MCRLFLSLTAIFLAATSTLSSAEVDYTVGPAFGWHFGHTGYMFEHAEGGSELIFPLDFMLAGIQAGMHSTVNDRVDWQVQAGVRLGITDPGGRFTDRDWRTFFGMLDLDWSYTESEVDMTFLELDVEATKLLVARDNMELSFLVGVSYQKTSQKALGFMGAQIEEGWNDICNDSGLIEESTAGLEYEVTYIKPQVGLESRLCITPQWSLSVKAAATPLLHVDDKDEHLLRNLRITADGRGSAFSSGFSLLYYFPRSKGHRQTSLELVGEFSTLRANLLSTWYWYGDDPFDPEDNTGNKGVGPHKVFSTQYTLSVRLSTPF